MAVPFFGTVRHVRIPTSTATGRVEPTFGADYVTGLVTEVSKPSLIIKVDYSRLFAADGLEGPIVSTDTGGTSGGPVYRIVSGPDGAALEIAGFIFEHSDQHFLRARHADCVQADGFIAD